MTFIRFYKIPPIMFPDAGTYTAVAKSISIGEGFTYIFFSSSPPLTGNPPGYPLIIAVCLLISGSNELIFMAKFISLVCGISLSIPTYLVGKKLFDKQVGLLGAILVTTNNYVFEYSRFALTEVIFSYFVMLIVYLAILFEERTNKQKEILVAISFLSGIAAVIRIVGYLIFAGFLFYIVLNTKKIRNKLVLSSFVIIAFAGTLVFWWVRNILLLGNIETFYNISALKWTLQGGNVFNHILTGLYSYTIFFCVILFGRESILFLYENYLAIAAIGLVFTICAGLYGLKSIYKKLGYIFVYFVFVSFMLLYLWWFRALVRFLVPFIPILTILIIGSMTKIHLPFEFPKIKLSAYTKNSFILAICSLIILSNVISIAVSIQKQKVPFTVVAGKWLKENTDLNALVYTSRYSEIYLYSERKCISPINTLNHSEMAYHILSKNADYVIAHPDDSRLSWLLDDEEVPIFLIVEYKDDVLELIIFSVVKR